MKIEFPFKQTKISVLASKENTQIVDSYKIKRIKDQLSIIKSIRKRAAKNYAIHRINLFNMINEWRAHNLLYDLGLYRNSTQHVDLDLKEPWYRRVLYTILSLFYFKY
jgi:hypothetical protein